MADTLRSAGNRNNIYMGAAVADYLFNNTTATNVLSAHYSSLTAENVMKWGNIHPQRGTYNWAAADRLVDFAEQNNQVVHGHTLLWHTELPSWAGPADLESHIKTIVGRYRGRVKSWDVVNEVLDENGSLRNMWYKDMIADAFRWAHEADPDALLFINDYNIETNRAKTNGMYAFVASLRNEGVPIHGVGFQCHFNTEWTPAGELQSNMKRFADMGLKVSVTEFDCGLKGTGTLTQQADHYRNMIKAAKALGSSMYAFTTWGFTDASTWLPGQKPLPFDGNYNPKPAFTAMLSELNVGEPTSTPDVYVVKAGDTFTSIANRYGLTPDKLAELNNTLKVGADLKTSFNPDPTIETYVAVTGDTWSSIAAKANISVDALMVLNNIRVAPGSSYIIKKTVPTPPPAPSDPYQTGLPMVDMEVPSARALQTELKRVGYMSTSVQPADNYGPKTQEAVAVFHNHNTQFRGTMYDPQIDEMGWAFLRGMATGSAVVSTPPVNTTGKINSNQVLFTSTSNNSGKAFAEDTVRTTLALMGLPVTDAWVNGYSTMALRESSYNPNAVNTYDSNAIGDIVSDGHPFQCSRGMWQCIPQTFANYHQAGTSLSIYDPIASCAASINYVRSRYGVNNDGSNLTAKVQQADPTRPPKGY